MTEPTYTVELTASDVLTVVAALKTERVKALRHANRAKNVADKAVRSLDVQRADHAQEAFADVHKRALDSIIGGTS